MKIRFRCEIPVYKKLSFTDSGNRGIFQNQDGIVSSLISKDEFHAIQSEKFVEETFDGSFPAFFNAFSSRKKLTSEEIAQVRQMIDSFETEE